LGIIAAFDLVISICSKGSFASTGIMIELSNEANEDFKPFNQITANLEQGILNKDSTHHLTK
jgi:hypothetical protein